MRRGLELSGAMLAALVDPTSGTSAPPSSLVQATLQAATSGQPRGSIAALVRAATPPLCVSKFRIVIGLLFAVSLLAAGAIHSFSSPAAAPDERSESAPAADKPKIAATVTVRGRVLDPDGKPVKGAKLYWPRVPKTEPLSEEDIEIPQRGRTDTDGRFEFELPRSDIKPEWNLALVAVADGYGVDWAELPKDKSPTDLTLRLVKDQAIQGRIVSTEGKPLVGAQVNVLALMATPEKSLEKFLTAWKREGPRAGQYLPKQLYVPLEKILPSGRTDKQGRFQLKGVGAERVANVRVKGAGVAQAGFYVVTRVGFDPEPYNRAFRERSLSEMRGGEPISLLYGPTFDYVAPAARIIEGTVRQAGSSKPVGGFRIAIGVGYGDSVSAVSNKEGRYRLTGVPKMKEYLLGAEPPENSSWLRGGARVQDREGLQTLKVDFTVARGIVVTGRVLDKSTGKGLAGSLRFIPLPGNKFCAEPGYDSFRYERLSTVIDAKGRFQLTVIPGPGVLLVQVSARETANGGQPVIPYKQAEFESKDREQVAVTETDDGDRYFTAADNSLEFLTINHVVKRLDFAPDVETAKCDVFVRRGKTMRVMIQDADGNPLSGATVAGIAPTGPSIFPMKDAACTVFALDPKRPRTLIFYHAERKLAGTLTVRGDEKETPVARLVRTGVVTGRVLDLDGQPIADADVQLSAPGGLGEELYRQLSQHRSPIRTDKNGRFRVKGIVPNLKFLLRIYHGRTFLVGEPRIGLKEVKPGETLDLGDIRTKPQR
jgi:uncharacterized GH25 family protein